MLIMMIIVMTLMIVMIVMIMMIVIVINQQYKFLLFFNYLSTYILHNIYETKFRTKSDDSTLSELLNSLHISIKYYHQPIF